MASQASPPVPASGGPGARASSAVPVSPATSGKAGGRPAVTPTRAPGINAGPGPPASAAPPGPAPAIGPMADSLGGLAGPGSLSIAFLAAATVLRYSAARRLLGRTEALIAAALWALSEPIIRLAFATYDPMSVFLAALAAWLAVQ